MTTNEHSLLITRAARRELRPLGLLQKGRSRTWIDDHGWYATVVEFQPSSWARGSYLNVGVCWLWVDKDYWSFDLGSRISGFREFHSVEQFEPLAEAMAREARDEVLRYRTLLPGPHQAYQVLAESSRSGWWQDINLAIAAALVGRPHEAVERAIALREQLRDVEANGGSMVRPMAAAIADAPDAPAVLGLIREWISGDRTKKKLPPWDTALLSSDGSTGANSG